MFFLTQCGVNILKNLPDVNSQSPWGDMAQSELDRALGVTPNTDVARNVILFLGDGMSISTVTASRILQGRQKDELGEGNYLAFEKFPNSGLIKVSKIFYNKPYRGFFVYFVKYR